MSSFKNAALEGLIFPEVAPGDRSTTATNRAAVAAALKAVDEQAAASAAAEPRWRHRYNAHIVKLVQVSCTSRANAVAIARAGLDYLHNTFEFMRDGKCYKLAEAMKNFTGTFETGFIKGQATKPGAFELRVPYKDKVLTGEPLKRQVNEWASLGVIEPDTAAAINEVVDNKTWLDLSDKYFVLLGAGSAMGPFLMLMELGANIIAIDLDRPGIWNRLIGVAEKSCGTLTFPLKGKQPVDRESLCAAAGCNLFTQTPEIKNWLCTVLPGKRLVVGGYAYLDGEAFVRVALAMDAIIEDLCNARKDTVVAFLNTPTHVYVVPDAARKAQQAAYSKPSLLNIMLTPVKLASKKMLVRNALPPVKADDGAEFSLCDGLVVPQGPNYALAKLMQHWRCILAREAGHVTSSNIAPSTFTASVVHNRQFAWAYGGMHNFEPLEIFYQETSNAVMGALLLHDVTSPASPASPKAVVLRNPWELFARNSFHGGVWRMGYKMDSIGAVSAVLYFWGKARLAVLVLALLFLAWLLFL